MADHIPFINIDKDCELLKKYYSDSYMIRVSLETINDIYNNIPRNVHLWIDPAIDGYHNILTEKTPEDSSYKDFIEKFDEKDILSNKSFLENPDQKKVSNFVRSVLDKCHKFKPKWITVPQLPLVEDTSRNKINKSLALATHEWKSSNKFEVKMILPLIFTHQNQLKGKTQWKPKINVAKNCYDNSGADAIWVVDSELDDQKGRVKFRDRFSKLVEFHFDLKKVFKEQIIIAGPYWGMNLVLWARGLCDYPAIGIGKPYKYYIPGGYKVPGKARIAIPPIRRWAATSLELEKWINTSLSQISPSDQAYKDFLKLKENYDLLRIKDAARSQVAEFYKRWFDKIESAPPAGRTLSLYQDLSSAYILGKQLDDLPKTEAPGRDPSRVAQQFMLNCL